jgi:AcrR family transcriptional regulator
MQQIVEETGLGKNLLYREFASKDELVAEWVRASDAQWWRMAHAAIKPYEGDPARQLLAVVEAVYDRVTSPDFHACVFYDAANEFRDAAHPGRRAAISHLRANREYLYQLARATSAREPQALADALVLIIGGILANGAALGPDGPARSAVKMAEAIIMLYCGQGALCSLNAGGTAASRRHAALVIPVVVDE